MLVGSEASIESWNSAQEAGIGKDVEEVLMDWVRAKNMPDCEDCDKPNNEKSINEICLRFGMRETEAWVVRRPLVTQHRQLCASLWSFMWEMRCGMRFNMKMLRSGSLLMGFRELFDSCDCKHQRIVRFKKFEKLDVVDFEVEKFGSSKLVSWRWVCCLMRLILLLIISLRVVMNIQERNIKVQSICLHQTNPSRSTSDNHATLQNQLKNHQTLTIFRALMTSFDPFATLSTLVNYLKVQWWTRVGN